MAIAADGTVVFAHRAAGADPTRRRVPRRRRDDALVAVRRARPPARRGRSRHGDRRIDRRRTAGDPLPARAPRRHRGAPAAARPRARPGRRLPGDPDLVPIGRWANRPRPVLRTGERDAPWPRGRTAPAGRPQPRWADVGGATRVLPRPPVLDLAWLRPRRRRLRRFDGLRTRLSRAAQRRLGRGGRRGLLRRGDLARRRRQGRRGAPGDPRRQRRRLHDARRAGVPRRVLRRRRLLRRRRPVGAGGRHPQVRVALPRRAGRSVAGGEGRSTTRAHRSTTSTASTARSSCSRAWRTRWCRPTRAR